MKKLLLIILFSLAFFSNSYAIYPEKRLEDEKLEERATNLFKEIRCLVCEAQSIQGSNTEFSSGLRKIIRLKITQGLDDQEIKSQLKEEFGDQIFMSADIESSLAIWILPFIFAIFFGFFLFYRKKPIL